MTTNDVKKKKFKTLLAKYIKKKNIDQIQQKLIKNFISTTFQSKKDFI